MPERHIASGPEATVRDHLARIEHGQMIAAIADYAEDGVLEARGAGTLEGSILTGTYQGREAIGRWIDSWFSSFERGSYRFEVEESIENGDRVYLVLHQTARGATSGADVTNRIHHVFTVRDGLIARHSFSGEREEMLRAAGIDSG